MWWLRFEKTHELSYKLRNSSKRTVWPSLYVLKVKKHLWPMIKEIRKDYPERDRRTSKESMYTNSYETTYEFPSVKSLYDPRLRNVETWETMRQETWDRCNKKGLKVETMRRPEVNPRDRVTVSGLRENLNSINNLSEWSKHKTEGPYWQEGRRTGDRTYGIKVNNIN